MELGLDHLAPYLPHKLYVLHFGEQKVLNTGYGSSVHWIGMSAALKYKDPQKLRPLLHPLSRLMDQDPMSILHIEAIVNESPQHCDAYDEWYEIFIDNPTHDKLLQAPYEIAEELFKQHYDVFGLIDKGLAEAIKSE